jgi:hypothetical protein
MLSRGVLPGEQANGKPPFRPYRYQGWPDWEPADALKRECLSYRRAEWSAQHIIWDREHAELVAIVQAKLAAMPQSERDRLATI